MIGAASYTPQTAALAVSMPCYAGPSSFEHTAKGQASRYIRALCSQSGPEMVSLKTCVGPCVPVIKLPLRITRPGCSLQNSYSSFIVTRSDGGLAGFINVVERNIPVPVDTWPRHEIHVSPNLIRFTGPITRPLVPE